MDYKALLVLGAAAGTLAAQPVRRPLLPQDRDRFVETGTPWLSPDGRWVLFATTRTNLAANRRHTTTWLARSDSAVGARLFLREGDRFLTWSPDSKKVYFFRAVPNGNAPHEELFEQRIADTAARKRSHLNQLDLGYGWQLSPDGSFFLLARQESAPDVAGEEFDAVFVDEGSNGQVRDYWSNLWRYDLDADSLVRITHRLWSVQSARPSPDGRRAVVEARPDNGRNTAWRSELYVVDLTTGTAQQLTHNEAPERNPQWFPDGRSILFEAVRLDRWEYGNGDLWRIDVESGKINNLTPNHTGRFVQPVIAPNGAAIYVASGLGTARFPVRIDLTSGRTTALITTNGAASVGSWSADRRFFAYRYQDATTPPDIFVGNAVTPQAASRRITELNPWIASEIDLGAVELVHWRSDSLTIEGLLTFPPQRPVGRGAMIVHVPCGPGCGWINEFSFRNQLLAGAGYAQLAVVVRGSSNYDDRFMQANRFDIGGGDASDVLTGVDAMVTRGLAHPDSIGIDGWSYGAILGGLLLTRTSRFRAASLGAMVSDWTVDYGASAHYDLERWYLGGTPWSNPARWRDRSSITRADRVRTPTLLHHGAEDQVDWPFHSMNYFAALKTAGTPVRLILYPADGHDLSLPQSVYVREKQDLLWMDRFIRGVRPAPPTTPR